MKKIIFLIIGILLIQYAFTTHAKLTLAMRQYDESSELSHDRQEQDSYYGTALKIKKALLEANGKDWYLKYVLFQPTETKYKRLFFIEIGDSVLTVGHKNIELAKGVKKAMDYLSIKNDTLFLPNSSIKDSIKPSARKYYYGGTNPGVMISQMWIFPLLELKSIYRLKSLYKKESRRSNIEPFTTETPYTILTDYDRRNIDLYFRYDSLGMESIKELPPVPYTILPFSYDHTKLENVEPSIPYVGGEKQ